jgi:hypothetical protein
MISATTWGPGAMRNLYCHRCQKWGEGYEVGGGFVCRCCGETIVCDECGLALGLSLEHEHAARGGHLVAVSDNGPGVVLRFEGRCSCGEAFRDASASGMEFVVARHLEVSDRQSDRTDAPPFAPGDSGVHGQDASR